MIDKSTDIMRANWLATWAGSKSWTDEQRDGWRKACVGLLMQARDEGRAEAAGFPINEVMHCWWCFSRQGEVSKFFASPEVPLSPHTKRDLGLDPDAVIEGMEGMCHPPAFICDSCVRMLSEQVEADAP